MELCLQRVRPRSSTRPPKALSLLGIIGSPDVFMSYLDSAIPCTFPTTQQTTTNMSCFQRTKSSSRFS